VYALLADHRHELFPAELFADVACQGGGHPSVCVEVVATVIVLQALEGLSDQEAISALRRDIAWKVACKLRLDDEGFHPTVLVHWRTGYALTSERIMRTNASVTPTTSRPARPYRPACWLGCGTFLGKLPAHTYCGEPVISTRKPIQPATQ
jgi:Transposase domain (DUF772)